MLKGKTGRRILILTAGMILLTFLFYWIAEKDWNYTRVRTEPITAYGVLPVTGDEGEAVEQVFRAEMDELETIGFVPTRLYAGTEGPVRVALKDAGGNVLWARDLASAELRYDEINEIPVSGVSGCRGKDLALRVEPGKTGISLQYGRTVSAGKIEVQAGDMDRLTLDEKPYEGRMLYAAQGTVRLGLAWVIWVLGGAAWLALVLFTVMTDRAVQKHDGGILFLLSEVWKRFSYLLKTLVLRDFRIKYQASLLGVLWSFLNPLLTMAVYLFVFSTIFKSNIEYFPAYLLTGIVVFNYFSESTSLGLNSIVANRALITKVYMPKMIYPLSKVLSSAINLLISFIPMFIVLLVTGVPFSKSMLLLPVAVGFLVAFCLGMTLILSTLTVFFRDTQFLWGILLTIWNFLTPIFYPESIIPAQFQTLYHMNPLYQIVYFMRCITIGGVSPTPVTYVYCALAAFVPLVLGILVFRARQDRFVLHL